MLTVRATGSVVSAALVVTMAVPAVSASELDGPRLAVVRSKLGDKKTAVVTIGPQGGRVQRVVGNPFVGGDPFTRFPPTWSPDGSSLALATGSRRRRVISIVPADSGQPAAIPNTRGGFLPVFSPDGRSIAFARTRNRRIPGEPSFVRYESTSVWIVDLVTGKSRQLTRWRDDLEHYPSSFSPDGSTLLVTRWDQERSGESEVVALRFDGRTSGLLVGEGSFPVYSPGGSTIALFRVVERRFRKKHHENTILGGEGTEYRVEENSELYVIDADGTRLRRLTRTPNKDEALASWDPSGERIAYAQFRRSRFNAPNSIMQINADGTCPTEVVSRKATVFYGPVWRPGPGRSAGRIPC